MDKSSTYIEMCLKAEEIQLLWRRTHGDFFVAEEGRIQCWVSGVHDRKKIKRQFGVCEREGVIHLTRHIWLPRLDQLMELAQTPGRRFEKISQEFHEWTRQPYHLLPGEPRKVFASLEQVWLGFVMHRKYLKKWDGKTWNRIYMFPASNR